MGKQSRRKKGNKKEQKERLKERRERAIEVVERDEEEEPDEHDEQQDDGPIEVGQRVFYPLDEEGGYWERAVVKKITGYNPNSEDVDLLPVSLKDEKAAYIRMQICDLIKDDTEWTLRFPIGERVLCAAGWGWVPATVTDLWPIDQMKDTVPAYRCEKERPPPGDEGTHLCAPVDTDDTIIKHPQAFRLSVGDDVIFSSERAIGLTNTCRIRSGPWLRGKITKVDVIDRSDYYACYECQYSDGGRSRKCLILKDDDEHVASVSASPRERLLSAIEQNCGYGHLDYLIKSSGLDVHAFSDLLVSVAIKYASYDALLWLQENLAVDLGRIRDNDENGLLHQIAKTSHAERFFVVAAAVEWYKRPSGPSIEVCFGKDGNDALFGQRNKQGRTFLHELIISNNKRALDLALSPRNGLAWSLSFSICLKGRYKNSEPLSDVDVMTRDKSGLKLKDTARLLGRFELEKMVDEFTDFQLLFDLYESIEDIISLERGKGDVPHEGILSKFGEMTPSEVARRLIHFYNHWCERGPESRRPSDIYVVVCKLSRMGKLSILSWLIEENLSLLGSMQLAVGIPMNRDEYVQNVSEELPEKREALGLVGHAAVGETIYVYADSEKMAEQHESYVRLLERFYDHRYHVWASNDKLSLASFFEKENEKRSLDYRISAMLDNKLRLLQDDDLLPDRLKVLDYLVIGKSLSPPPVLDVIRWRQCGVLRWLVENSFVDLGGKACHDSTFVREGATLKFLVGQEIPETMTVGAFLCFVAVEFDDLQSFQWLVEANEIPLSCLKFNGVNAVHHCAGLGRAEIFLWLMQSQSLPALTSLVKKECTRGPWSGYFASHIAAEKGFTFLSGLLLSSGCPLENSAGTTVFQLAKQSKVEAVREWGQEKELPLRLENDIGMLLHLLADQCSLKEIKSHLAKSKCMDPTRWQDCDFFSVNEPGPRGMNYTEILDRCCVRNDPEFIVWLCQEHSPSTNSANIDTNMWDLFWGFDPWALSRDRRKFFDSRALIQFTCDQDNDVLYKCLEKAWAADVSCVDPFAQNHLLRYLLEYFREDSAISTALALFRDKLLTIGILSKVHDKAIRETRRLFARGAQSDHISDLMDICMKLADERAIWEGRKVEEYFSDGDPLSSDGRINLESYLFDCKYERDHPLSGMVEWRAKPLDSVERLYLVLAIEGHSELISWTHSEGRGNWDAEKETEVVRIAAYLGHTDIVDIFLRRKVPNEFLSSEADCHRAAVLGAAETGRLDELASYWDEWMEVDQSLNPIVDDFEDITLGWQDLERERDLRRKAVASSLVGSTVHGCLTNVSDATSDGLSKGHVCNDFRAIVKWMLLERVADAKDIVHAIPAVVQDLSEVYSYERCIDFLDYLVRDLGADVLQSEKDIIAASKKVMSFAQYHTIREDTEEAPKNVLRRWLVFISQLGFDIQQLDSGGLRSRTDAQRVLASHQAEQLLMWEQFDLIKKGHALTQIKAAVEGGDIDLKLRYRGGFLFTHLSAAYDRLDVLQWLIEDKDMSLATSDGIGRSVLEVAQASNAVAVSDWIALNTAGNVIAAFVSTHFRRRRAHREKLHRLWCLMKIQAWQRGNVVRRVSRGRLLSRLDAMQRFNEIWTVPMSLLSNNTMSVDDWTWQAIKQQEHDIMRVEEFVDDEDGLVETSQKLEEAATQALTEMNKTDVNSSSSVQEETDPESGGEQRTLETSHSEMRPCNFARIKLTRDVVKWLRHSDNKFRGFFIRRINQLAAGDRSRILAKRLTGSNTLIYETYLEQKSGHRILWTESSDDSLLVWYVAKHKSVSRLMGLIDDAESRSSRQLTSAASLPEMKSDTEEPATADKPESERIMLDPLGDTPLKLYEVYPDEINKLNDPSWKPRLYLTAREREVVETAGTVLLLGRSGTGKTCVIGNRMDYDRQRRGCDPDFRQLFVARSQGLCDYVKGAVDSGHDTNTRFDTFNEAVSSLERTLPSSASDDKLFLPSLKMDFVRFKRDFYRSESFGDLDALVVWTNIRSFIKGSIEALQHPNRALPEEDYLSLGKKRCRLSPEQRKSVYAVFERYERYMHDLKLWDDCDRITALAHRLENARSSDSLAFQEVRYSKLYVDEVQDYTQAEIAVFFYLCGPGDLFLAGDPAQSVVEGVEFRFEEIRSVGYHLYGEERRHLIPDKPKTVHVNFRSHCGILNVAAAVLSCLFQAFPDSAKQLKEDQGLFQGPRPGVFHKVEAARLQELVSKRNGIVVLTHDRSVSKWKRALRDYPLVYGIREAKGLEFKEVILVDFFVGIPKSLQKLWRNLLLGRDVADISCRPEIEGHLKLLYTATTRCIQRLFFAETCSSVAGDAFVRWLTTTSTNREVGDNKEALAVKNSVENVEMMVRTPDEWRSAGLDNAVMAESVHELSETETWLDRALYCFEQVGDSALASRARTQRSSIRFRMKLSQDTSDDMDVPQAELDAALLTEQLLAERLYSEAREVCCAILPLLDTRAQETLQTRLISMLPSDPMAS